MINFYKQRFHTHEEDNLAIVLGSNNSSFQENIQDNSLQLSQYLENLLNFSFTLLILDKLYFLHQLWKHLSDAILAFDSIGLLRRFEHLLLAFIFLIVRLGKCLLVLRICLISHYIIITYNKFNCMTLYFRPNSIHYEPQTSAIQSNQKQNKKIPSDLKLKIETMIQDQQINLLQYYLDGQQFMTGSKFIGLSLNNTYVLKVDNFPEGEQIKNRITLNQAGLIKKVKVRSSKIFQDTINVGDFKLNFSYGYNKFLEVSGMSKFYEFRMEPTGKLAEKIKHLTIIESASQHKFDQKEKVTNRNNEPSDLIALNTGSLISAPLTPISRRQASEQQVKQKIQKIKDENSSLPLQLKKQKQKQKPIFYKGPCKSTNMFSCLDPRGTIEKHPNEWIQSSYI